MQCGTLYIAHVYPAALAFELGKTRYQRTAQLRHAVLVQPRSMLLQRSVDAHALFLHRTHLLDAGDFVAEFAWCAGLHHQCGQCVG